MAQVDFSNAILSLPSSFFPLKTVDAALYGSGLYNANNQQINSNYTSQIIVNEEKRLVIAYSGTFNASGTEFYFGAVAQIGQKWKMSNISFNSGDTYVFQVPITLTCN